MKVTSNGFLFKQNQGLKFFSTHNFWLEGGCAEVFVQNLTDCTYVQRLTWIRKGFKNHPLKFWSQRIFLPLYRTMVIFDETNNVHLSPFLGTNHDLLSANDTAVIRNFSTIKYIIILEYFKFQRLYWLLLKKVSFSTKKRFLKNWKTWK